MITPWTDGEIATLKRLWPTHSALTIARHHLPGRSRSAVIGMADRLGLDKAGTRDRTHESHRRPVQRLKRPWAPSLAPTAVPVVPEPPVSATEAVRPRVQPVITLPDGSQTPQPRLCNGNVARWAYARGGPRRPVTRAEDTVTEQPRPPSDAVTIDKLRWPIISQCRYILGDVTGWDTTLYCGAEVQYGSSYCQEHFERTRAKPARFAEAAE